MGQRKTKGKDKDRKSWDKCKCNPARSTPLGYGNKCGKWGHEADESWSSTDTH